MNPGASSRSVPASEPIRAPRTSAPPKAAEMPTMPPCGVLVFEKRHAAGFTDQLAGRFSQFHLVISGHTRWESGSRRYLLGPDTLCHIPAGQSSRQEIPLNEPASVYVIHYRPELLSSLVGGQLSALGIVPVELGSTNSNQARVVRSIFQEMLFEQAAGQEGWEQILQSRLIDLAVRTLRFVRRRGRDDLPAFEPGSDSTERVAQYALRLRSRFYRQETLSEAARAVGLSRRQFTELFRKVTGQSWRRYVLGLRLTHAAELLAETDRSVLAVAFESGFEDLSHFHHCFKSVHGCSPMAYREQRQVRVSLEERPPPQTPGGPQPSVGFKWRGMKGWFWTADQYLEEVEVLSSLKMNFLMDCYGSMIVSRPGEPWCNEWWKPMTDTRKAAFRRVIRACQQSGITFCFALHPQLASPRPLDPASREDLDLFYSHYAWAQAEGVSWFSVCLDGTSWGPGGPTTCGTTHAGLVSTILDRLRTEDRRAQVAFCPVACWGDGTNPEHHAYLEALAREMHPDAYAFWNGDSIVTPRITCVAAESYRSAIKHRLFLWDNYPVNDGSPTLHLGPVSGREAGLFEVVDGYLSNPMCTQNQINRIPLATCADYASNPRAYDPARSISQAVLRFGKTDEQRHVLKELVEAYPGFIVAGGGTGTNPVRGKFGSLLASSASRAAAADFLAHIEDVAARLSRQFPKSFPATKKTLAGDLAWMGAELARFNGG